MAFWYFCQKVGQEIRSDFSDFIRFFPFFRLFPTLRLSDSTALVKMPTPYLRKVLATVWCRFGSWNYVVTRPSRILGQGCSSQVGTFWGVLYISLHAFAYGTQLGELTNRGGAEINKNVPNTFSWSVGGPNWPFWCLDSMIISIIFHKIRAAPPPLRAKPKRKHSIFRMCSMCESISLEWMFKIKLVWFLGITTANINH